MVETMLVSHVPSRRGQAIDAHLRVHRGSVVSRFQCFHGKQFIVKGRARPTTDLFFKQLLCLM